MHYLLINGKAVLTFDESNPANSLNAGKTEFWNRIREEIKKGCNELKYDFSETEMKCVILNEGDKTEICLKTVSK